MPFKLELHGGKTVHDIGELAKSMNNLNSFDLFLGQLLGEIRLLLY